MIQGKRYDKHDMQNRTNILFFFKDSLGKQRFVEVGKSWKRHIQMHKMFKLMVNSHNPLNPF